MHIYINNKLICIYFFRITDLAYSVQLLRPTLRGMYTSTPYNKTTTTQYTLEKANRKNISIYYNQFVVKTIACLDIVKPLFVAAAVHPPCYNNEEKNSDHINTINALSRFSWAELYCKSKQ